VFVYIQVFFRVTTTPIDTKTNRSPGRGCTKAWQACAIKYLGMHVASGKTLIFDVSPMKRAFYAACNSIFANTDGRNEMALLSLQEAYSLSLRTFPRK